MDAEKWIEVQAKLLHLEAELRRCEDSKKKFKRAWHDHPALIVALLGVPLIVAIAKKP